MNEWGKYDDDRGVFISEVCMRKGEGICERGDDYETIRLSKGDCCEKFENKFIDVDQIL